MTRENKLIWAGAALLLLAALPAGAANVCVRAGAAGAGTGLNWTDALTDLPASPTRGNTYYVAAGNYSQDYMLTANSGTTRIVIRKATVADHGTATGWLDSYASGKAVFGWYIMRGGYLTVDGAYGNNTDGYGFKFGSSATAGKFMNIENGYNAHGITLANLEVYGPIAVGSQSGYAGSDTYGINVGGNGSGIANVVVSNCWIHGMSTPIQLAYTTNVLITKCIITDAQGTPGGDPYTSPHANLIWSESGVNVEISYCTFTNWATEGIFPGEYWNPNPIINWKVHNNFFFHPTGWPNHNNNGAGRGFVIRQPEPGRVANAYNIACYNNTFVGVRNSVLSDGSWVSGATPVGAYAGTGGANWTAYNNLFYDCGDPRTNSIGVSMFALDHNWYSDDDHGEANSIDGSGVNPFTTLPQIVGTVGANYPADKGADLGSAYAVDWNGNTRSGTWDIGAVEYGGAPPAGGPNVSINPATLVWPARLPGEQGQQSFAVVSTGSEQLDGELSSSSAAFVLSVTNVALVAGATTNVTVAHTYAGAGTNPVTIEFVSTGHETNNRTVTGHAVAVTPFTNRWSAAAAHIFTGQYATNGGYLWQGQDTSSGTNDASGNGEAWYWFTNAVAGDYKIRAVFRTPVLDANHDSVWVNVDGPMSGANDTNYNVWDTPSATVDMQTNWVRLRGETGTFESWNYDPWVISNLTAAVHYLYLVSRERVELQSFELLPAGTTGGVTNEAPTIVEPPQNLRLISGGSGEMSVEAVGTTPLTYQWYVTGGIVPMENETNATLTFTDVSPLDEDDYYGVLVSNAVGTVWAWAALEVDTVAEVFRQPVGGTVSEGAYKAFTVIADGSTPISYQWQLNSEAIAGATGASYVIESATTNDAGSYSVLVTNDIGGELSDEAVLTVGTIPTIVTGPAGVVVNEGEFISLWAESAGSALWYRWLFNGEQLPYTATNVYIPATAAAQGGWSMVAGGAAGNATSATAAVWVRLRAAAQPVGFLRQ